MGSQRLAAFTTTTLNKETKMDAFQDHYPENVAHCYGCGHLNTHGHQIKTIWDGDETVTHFQPEHYHTSVPGFAYGGLIASLIDCHSTGTAAAAMYRQEGRDMDSLPAFRFVTGSLHVDFLKPTPLNSEMVIRGRVKEIKGRKVVVETTVYASGVATARGEVVAVQMPDSFGQNPTQKEAS
jgi:acyl-coenzyme A thioesterase PaaI-like protein